MASCFKDPNRPPPRLGPPLHTPRPGDLTRGPRRNPQPDPHARAPPKPPPRPPIRDPDRDPGWDPGALPKISLAKANIPFQGPQKLAVAANWSLLSNATDAGHSARGTASRAAPPWRAPSRSATPPPCAAPQASPAAAPRDRESPELRVAVANALSAARADTATTQTHERRGRTAHS